MKFRKKPVIVEAIQWTGNNYEEICNFVGYKPKYQDDVGCEICKLEILTLEGKHIASKNDWIIRGVKGEFYPVKKDIFLETYEKVN